MRMFAPVGKINGLTIGGLGHEGGRSRHGFDGKSRRIPSAHCRRSVAVVEQVGATRERGLTCHYPPLAGPVANPLRCLGTARSARGTGGGETRPRRSPRASFATSKTPEFGLEISADPGWLFG